MAVISAFLFGAATPASKLLLQELAPFQLAGLLYLGAALAVAPVALKGGRLALPGRADRSNQMRLLGAVLFGGVLGPVALLFALRLSEAASVSLWLTLELAATAILGVLLFRDHLSRRGWLGVGAVFLACTVLASGPDSAGVRAALLVAFACLCWGLDNHLTALIDGITPSQSTLWKGAVAGTVNLMIGATLAPLSVGVPTLALALLIGALSYGASIVLYIHSAQILGATRAQVMFASAPFFGAALSIIVVGEHPSLTYAIAVPLFLIGVVLLLVESHTHLHSHETMFHEHSHRHDDGHHTHVHEGLADTVRHTHPHHHEPISHRHPHWPDLQHRHRHESEEE